MSNTSNTSNTIALIEQRLTAAFAPAYLDVVDESHLHVGHAGAESGKGHYVVEIHSDVFQGILPIARHRLVYEALGQLMETHIHALSIKTKVVS